MKIAVIGYSGAGKSTFTQVLAEHYIIPCMYLDKVNFLAAWKSRDRDEARSIVQDFMRNESWIMDGNYKDLYQKERLEAADKIFFFNLPRLYCLKMAIKRQRENKGKVRPSAANGCIEKLDAEFLWWILVGGRTLGHKKHYCQIVSLYRSKTIVFKSRKDVNRSIKALKSKQIDNL